MLSNNVSTLKLGGIEYPFKCDLIVLEKVQEKYEDLVKVEDGLRGFIPRIDACRNGMSDPDMDGRGRR